MGKCKIKKITNGVNKMSYPKLETIPFETIAKVVKNCTTIKKKERKNEKMKEKKRKK